MARTLRIVAGERQVGWRSGQTWMWPLFNWDTGSPPAIATEVIEITDRAGAVIQTERAAADPAFAILQVVGADLGYQALGLVRRLGGWPPCSMYLEPRQRYLGGLTLIFAANASTVFVAQGHAPLSARWSVIPGVGLFPVPGRALGTSAPRRSFK
jgi:hypothetical protein